MGPRSSALVGGYSHMHRELEDGLALLKDAEDALLFPTGATGGHARGSRAGMVGAAS